MHGARSESGPLPGACNACMRHPRAAAGRACCSSSWCSFHISSSDEALTGGSPGSGDPGLGVGLRRRTRGLLAPPVPAALEATSRRRPGH